MIYKDNYKSPHCHLITCYNKTISVTTSNWLLYYWLQPYYNLTYKHGLLVVYNQLRKKKKENSGEQCTGTQNEKKQETENKEKERGTG